jgi:uncharacterized cupin superfamily protein
VDRVAIEDVPPDAIETDSERRRLADPLGAEGVAVTHYRVAPGDGLPAGLHAHPEQEELFVVLAGVAAFEVLLPREDGHETREVTVEASEAVRFAPGEFQSGHNAGDDELVVFAFGAPREAEPVLTPLPCPDCGHDELRIDAAASGVELVCPDCAAAHVPGGCPDCGAEMRATLRRGDVGVACPACGHEQTTPPLTRS